jgi:transposase
MGRYDLTDFEWEAIKLHRPNKPRDVPSVDDRQVLNGIFRCLCAGAPYAALSEENRLAAGADVNRLRS